MKLTNSQKSVLQRINKSLEVGDLRIIAEKTGLTYEYVRRVINPFIGNYNNDVIGAAIELITERERIRKETLSQLPA